MALKQFQYIQKKIILLNVIPEAKELGFVGIPNKINNRYFKRYN